MPNKRFMITSEDKVVDITDQAVVEGNGLMHIHGKVEPGDRQKYTMKTDPTLVKEYIKGKETTNLGRQPILVYDYNSKATRRVDSWTANVVCFGLGAGLMGCLYFWGIITIFAK